MKTTQPPVSLVAALFWLALTNTPYAAASPDQSIELKLIIKSHRFEPSELKVAANRRIRLTVHNQDSTPEEFESTALKREKIIIAGGKATILIGPLKPGRYEFVGEYHASTAKGVLISE